MDVRTTLEHTTLDTMHACVYSVPTIDSACLLLLFSLFLGSFLTSRPLSVLRCIILFQYN